MTAIFEYLHTVQEDEIDELRHVNNLQYIKWMLAAALAHSAARGWPASRYLQLGAGWVVRTHQVHYLRPAFIDDEVVVRTWICGFKRITSRRKYSVLRRRDAAILAEARTDWAFVSYKSHSPRRIPVELIDSFEVVPDETEPY